MPPSDLDADLFDLIKGGMTISFGRDPQLTSMVCCTVTAEAGEFAYSVCPDLPHPARLALRGALKMLADAGKA